MLGIRDVTLSPIAPAALCTLADAKLQCGVSDSSQDAYLTRLMVAAAAAIEAYCNNVFTQRTVTEIITTEDAVSGLMLRHAPFGSVTSLERDDSGSGWVAETLSDFRLLASTGVLRRKDGAVLTASTYRVVYVVGYASVAATPPGIVQAALEMTRQLYVAKDSPIMQGITQTEADDVGSTTYAKGGVWADAWTGPTGAAVPAAVAASLGPYVVRFTP